MRDGPIVVAVILSMSVVAIGSTLSIGGCAYILYTFGIYPCLLIAPYSLFLVIVSMAVGIKLLTYFLDLEDSLT